MNEWMKSVFDSKNFFKFTCSRSVQVTFVEKPQVKLISSQNHKHWYLIHTKSDKAFQDNVVNRTMPALNGGSFQILLTVPLISRDIFTCCNEATLSSRRSVSSVPPPSLPRIRPDSSALRHPGLFPFESYSRKNNCGVFILLKFICPSSSIITILLNCRKN